MIVRISSEQKAESGRGNGPLSKVRWRLKCQGMHIF